MDAPASRSRLARVCSVLAGVLAVFSPVVLYFAVTRGRIEEGALHLFAYAVLRAFPAVVAAPREHLLAALRLPAVAIVSGAVGIITREPRALLALPSASQLAFAIVFLSSLRGVPLVEHFARMKTPSLGPRQIAYCRTVTKIWGLVLLAAAALGAVLAVFARVEVWAAVTTVGSYALIAVVFSVEFVVRRILFREYGKMPVDRLLRLVFPPLPPPVRDLKLDIEGDHATVLIPREYVFFRGHFDTLPMLPAVTQVTELLVPIAQRMHPTLGALRALRRVRFRRPVFPGETVHVDLRAESDASKPDETTLHFELRVGKATVANGTLTFAVKHAP